MKKVILKKDQVDGYYRFSRMWINFHEKSVLKGILFSHYFRWDILVYCGIILWISLCITNSYHEDLQIVKKSFKDNKKEAPPKLTDKHDFVSINIVISKILSISKRSPNILKVIALTCLVMIICYLQTHYLSTEWAQYRKKWYPVFYKNLIPVTFDKNLWNYLNEKQVTYNKQGS